MTAPPIFQRAFTLVELVIVLAVTGAMVAAVALFLRWPFQAYLDTARRAEISDIADTALRRIGRDLDYFEYWWGQRQHCRCSEHGIYERGQLHHEPHLG